jgi:hypothetical protein
MPRKILFFTLISLIFLLLPMEVLAAPNDTVTINVTVEQVSQITVFPHTLLWNALPGYNGTPALVDIINTGSNNVSSIYAYVDTLQSEPFRPYGSPNSLNYSAGSVITFMNNSYNKYFFAGRLEWNSTADISNMIYTGVTSPRAWGFFRNTTYEYNWLVGNGTGGWCNNTATQFAISDYPDNGSASTRTPDKATINCDQADQNYTYCSISRATAPLYESCAAIYYDCTKIYIYRYDKRPQPNFGLCGNSRYLQINNLVPHDVHTLTLNVFIPLGMPYGLMNTTVFSVFAT